MEFLTELLNSLQIITRVISAIIFVVSSHQWQFLSHLVSLPRKLWPFSRMLSTLPMSSVPTWYVPAETIDVLTSPMDAVRIITLNLPVEQRSTEGVTWQEAVECKAQGWSHRKFRKTCLLTISVFVHSGPEMFLLKRDAS